MNGPSLQAARIYFAEMYSEYRFFSIASLSLTTNQSFADELPLLLSSTSSCVLLIVFLTFFRCVCLPLCVLKGYVDFCNPFSFDKRESFVIFASPITPIF